MIKIETIKRIKAAVAGKLVGQIASAVSAELKIRTKWEATLVLVGKAEIKKLNKRYRKKDKVTDVLSFSSLAGGISLPGEQGYLGDVVICYPQLVLQAKKNGWSFREEFSLLLVHGLLHLLGYHHEESEKEARRMAKLERKILAKIGIKKTVIV